MELIYKSACDFIKEMFSKLYEVSSSKFFGSRLHHLMLSNILKMGLVTSQIVYIVTKEYTAFFGAYE